MLPEEAGKAENEQTGWSRGFDVVLGNPPWEKVKLQGKENGSPSESPEIAAATPMRPRRETLKKELADTPSHRFGQFKFLGDLRFAEGSSHRFYAIHGIVSLCGRGDVNTSIHRLC